MPQRYLGVRVPFTMRLPADLHREAAKQAKRRGWSTNQYLVWCVTRGIDRDIPSPVGERLDPILYDDDGARMSAS